MKKHSRSHFRIGTVLIPLAAVVLIAAIVVTFLAVSRVTVTQTKYEDTIELGNSYAPTAGSYMTANKEKAVAQMTIDASKVNTSAVGDYQVPITYKDRTYYVTVHVVDTTAPVVTAKTGDPIYNVSDNIVPAELVDVDEKTEYSLYFVVDGTDKDSITASEPGKTTLTVGATDTAGNVSAPVQVSVTIVSPDTTAPVISGVKESITINAGDKEPDYMKSVTAKDDTDGDVTASVSCDSSAVKADKAGKYKVTYSVADAAGNTSSAETTLIVKEKKEETADTDTAKTTTTEKTTTAAKATTAATASSNSTTASASVSQDAAAVAAAQTAAAAAAAQKAAAATSGYPSFVVPTNGVDLAGAQTIYKYWKNKGYTDAQIQSYWGDLTFHYAGHGTSGW